MTNADFEKASLTTKGDDSDVRRAARLPEPKSTASLSTPPPGCVRRFPSVGRTCPAPTSRRPRLRRPATKPTCAPPLAFPALGYCLPLHISVRLCAQVAFPVKGAKVAGAVFEGATIKAVKGEVKNDPTA